MTTANELEVYMLGLINEDRTSRGMGTLKLELNLNLGAERHSRWMLDTGNFSHTGVNGSTATDRIRAAGFDLSGSWGTAENLGVQSARGVSGYFDDVRDLHIDLMNSPGHRANLLDPALKFVGIGIIVDNFDYPGGGSAWSVMVTQKFGRTGGTVDLDPADPSYVNVPARTLTGNGFNNNLTGAAGDDVISGLAGHDTMSGMGGDDEILGGTGTDRLYGGDGDDALFGNSSVDMLYGGAGHDTLSGGDGVDQLYGDSGNDLLMGRTGIDSLYGGAGHDSLWGSEGTDSLYGGDNNDTLYGGSGGDTLFGGGSLDEIYGNEGADVIRGDTGNDTVYGGSSTDTLYGNAGDDTLLGGEGADRLDGGGNNDLLRGGSGADTFVYTPQSGTDGIVDFEQGVDVLRINDANWSDTLTTRQVITTFGTMDGDIFVLDFGGDHAIRLQGDINSATLHLDLQIA